MLFHSDISSKEVMAFIKETNIRYVNCRFTDPKGGWHHITFAANAISENMLSKDHPKDGIMFDGSSIDGFKPIHNSDMVLKPDSTTAFLDPFSSEPTLVLTCDIHEPESGLPYTRDPRSTAKRAEAYLKETTIGDIAYFGPEPEFFIFDDVRFDTQPNGAFYALDSEEGDYNTGRTYDHRNMGHRPRVKGGYMPAPPVDMLAELRNEMLDTIEKIGLIPEKHHHEVAPGQCEIGYQYNSLCMAADQLQMCKYVVRNVAHAYGKTASFMPKPIMADNGSGLHVHQSLWKNGAPLFAGNAYEKLSETALYYIGGIIAHARALNAFTNPTTNSYKRLVPGYEAPVLLAYSARNRSASIRIPFAQGDNAQRIEARFPDPAANPYYCFAALLMAGLDGIKQKIHPGDAMDQNLYELPDSELQQVSSVCSSLRESIEALEKDNAFLCQNNVFSLDQIYSYTALLKSECEILDKTPHPVEFKLYYSV